MANLINKIDSINVLYYSKNSTLEAVILCRTGGKETGNIKFYKTDSNAPANTAPNNLITLNYTTSRFADIYSLLQTGAPFNLVYNPSNSVGYIETNTTWVASGSGF